MLAVRFNVPSIVSFGANYARYVANALTSRWVPRRCADEGGVKTTDIPRRAYASVSRSMDACYKAIGREGYCER